MAGRAAVGGRRAPCSDRAGRITATSSRRRKRASEAESRPRLSLVASWLFHTYRPNAAILIAAFVLYELSTVHPRPPLVVWIIVIGLGLGWFGFVLRTLRFSEQGIVVTPSFPLATMFLLRRVIPYHDVLRARYRCFLGFWGRMEIITARGTLQISALALRPNRRLLKDLKRFCPEKTREQ